MSAEAKPIISVIIPCFNHGNYIQEAIDSVLAYKDSRCVEIIVINDGSTDAFTQQKLNEINHPQVKVIHQKNGGLGKARNVGIEASQAKYILPLDADNKIDPRYISESIKILEQNENIGVIYSDKYIFTDDSKTLIRQNVQNFDINQLLLGNYIDACAVFRKSLWSKVGGYAEDMPIMGLEDWEFWISLSAIGAVFYHIKKPLYLYRNLPNSMIKSAGKKSQIAAKYILEKHSSFYASQLSSLSIQMKYPIKKPFQHLVRQLLSMPFRPKNDIQ